MNKERQEHIDDLVQKSIHSRRKPMNRRKKLERTLLLAAGLFTAGLGFDKALNFTNKTEVGNPVYTKLVNRPEVNGVPEVSEGEISVTSGGNLVTVAIGIEDNPAIKKAFHIQSNPNSNYKVTLEANNFTTDRGQISFPKMNGSIGETATITKVSNGTSSEIASDKNSYILVFTGENSQNSINFQSEVQNTGISGEYAIRITNNVTGNSKNLMKTSFQTS